MSTIAMIALVVGVSLAQDAPQHSPHGKGGKHKSMMADIPDLTDDQKAQLKEIKESASKKIEGPRKELRDIREQIVALKQSEKPDVNQINELIDKSSLLKADVEKAKVATELKMRTVLTPEQLKVFDAKRKEKMEMRKKNHAQKNK